MYKKSIFLKKKRPGRVRFGRSNKLKKIGQTRMKENKQK